MTETYSKSTDFGGQLAAGQFFNEIVKHWKFRVKKEQEISSNQMEHYSNRRYNRKSDKRRNIRS